MVVINHGELFLFHRKVRPMKQKTLRGDRTAAERKIAALQPAAGGESCEQDSFLTYRKVRCWLNV